MAFGWKSMFLLWVVTTNYIGSHFSGKLSGGVLLWGPGWRWRFINGIMKWSVIAHNGPPAGRREDDGLSLFNLSLICSLSETATDNSLIFSPQFIKQSSSSLQWLWPRWNKTRSTQELPRNFTFQAVISDQTSGREIPLVSIHIYPL